MKFKKRLRNVTISTAFVIRYFLLNVYNFPFVKQYNTIDADCTAYH